MKNTIDNFDNFFGDIEKVYRHPQTQIVRLADDIITKHKVKASGLELIATRFAPGSGLFLKEHFAMELSNRHRLLGAPRLLYDTKDAARMTFMHLEKLAMDSGITNPMPLALQNKIIALLEKTTTRTYLCHTKKPSERTSFDTFKINLHGIAIHGIIEYNSYLKPVFEYAVIRNQHDTMPIPRLYNTINSNDTAFAQRIITELKKHVR